jgi:pheromone alpha factor receptor
MSTGFFPIYDQSFDQLNNQSFNFVDFYGDNVTLTLDEIRLWISESTIEGIAYGIATGLCSTLLVAMMFLGLQDPAKLRRPIFLLNAFGLFFVSFRGILQNIALCGPFYGFEQYFLAAPVRHQNVFINLLIIKTIIQIFLYVSILATLILQVRLTFSASRRNKIFITVILVLIATTILGLELIYGVWEVLGFTTNKVPPTWFVRVSGILFITFLVTCSLMFLYKLGRAIRQRKILGTTRFGPFQVLFIMNCHCLVVPGKCISDCWCTDFIVIFYALCGSKLIPMPNIFEIGQAVLVCSFPISAIWASTETTDGPPKCSSSNAGAILDPHAKNHTSGKIPRGKNSGKA